MDDPVSLPKLLRDRPRGASDGIDAFDPDQQVAPHTPAFRGLCIIREFLSVDAAETLLREIEESPFSLAQSGKSKQHYGAKINFNKRRINPDPFEGFPPYVHPLEEKMKEAVRAATSDSSESEVARTRAVDDFVATDAFVLRYDAADRSNLDFHIDDLFAYGEGIFDLSLESDSTLTFVRERPSEPGRFACVRAALPARSLAFLYGPARFDWEHAILAYDIEGRRTSITLRTLSPEARKLAAGQRILSIARGKSRLPPPN